MEDLQIIQSIQTIIWGNSTTEATHWREAVAAIKEVLEKNGYGPGDDSKTELVYSTEGSAVSCENCGWEGLEEETLSIDSHSLLDRLAPGCPVPRGECPSLEDENDPESQCRSFCYYVESNVISGADLSGLPFADDECEDCLGIVEGD